MVRRERAGCVHPAKFCTERCPELEDEPFHLGDRTTSARRVARSGTGELRGVADRISQANPENEGTSATAQPLEEVVLGDVKPTLRMLTAAVLLVLVIAWANVANLLLVRGAARFREIAVRSALGASSRRIMQQLLTEAVILALVGGAIGVQIAVAMVRAFAKTIPRELPRVADVGVHLDWRVALPALALTVVSGVLCGMLPAVQLASRARRHGEGEMLREGSRGVAGGRRSSFVRSALAAGQVAIALVLLVTSGLFARSLWRLAHRDIGVRPEHVLSVRLVLPANRALDSAASVRFFDEVVRRVSAVPGVTMAGLSSHLPLTGGGETKSFYIEGRAPATLAELPSVVGRMESARSLPSLGATLVRGRWFSESDRGRAPLVAIINDGVARRFFGDANPIGQRIVLHRPEALTPSPQLAPRQRRPRWTVIGVVRDVNYATPRDEPERAVYVPYPQGAQFWSWGPQWLVARTAGDPAGSANAIRAALRDVDPDLPLDDVMPLTERTSESLMAPRLTASLVAAFATVAVLLAVIGLYGVIAYAVSRESRAFGVRVALGATTADVLRHVLARGARLAIVGVGVGLAASLVATAWIKSQLFGVRPLDAVTIAAATATVVFLTLLASYFPARRAARVDPLVALRSE
jgi:putative ABC transport system permease protein